MKRIYLFVIVTVSLALALSAAENSRWLQFTKTNDGRTVYIDSETLNYQNAAGATPTNVTAWTKWADASGGYNAIRYQFTSRQFRVLSAIDYGADGAIKDSSDKASDWMELPPDSIAEAMAKFLLVTVPAHFREHPQKSSDGRTRQELAEKAPGAARPASSSGVRFGRRRIRRRSW